MPNGLTIATFSRSLALVNYHRKIVLPCYYSWVVARICCGFVTQCCYNHRA